jgi:hypothetical protein
VTLRTPETNPSLKKPTATLVLVDRIIQVNQHCHELFIREHQDGHLGHGSPS